jgi:uroporphyrinogen-III synthase
VNAPGTKPTKPLSGWRVLVPRGGKWGDSVAAALRGYGGIPVIAPLINFASSDDPTSLANALHELQDGQFSWLVVTSATTVDVLNGQRVKVPKGTRIAAVGETTASALQLAGYRVDFVPTSDNSARGLVKEWPDPAAAGRVLVPRGGKWGDSVAAALRGHGGIPVIAPLINFASSDDPATLANALHELQDGQFSWLVVTSATTVDVLNGQRVKVPENTRIAAVGETTASALQLAGYRVDFVPTSDNSARGLVKEWPDPAAAGRVLVPQSDLSDPTLVAGLTKLGFEVEFVTAYRTVGVPVSPDVARDVASGRIRAVLVTSGSVARQVAEQLAPLPNETVVACIGPRTAFDTRAAGLPVHVIAEERSTESLIEALIEYAEAG